MESPAKKAIAHPKVSIMVEAAIKSLSERKGSSLQAINKYISANYSVDAKKLSVYIKKYLKSAVESGDIIQPSGKGATGSFKINKNKVEEKPKVPKVKSVKSLKMQTSTPKKTLKPKKATTKSPQKSPVKKLKLPEDEEVAADATLSKPKAKVAKKTKISLPTNPRKSKLSLLPKMKKPRKLKVKNVNKLQATVSPKPKTKKTATSPKTEKTTTSPKTVKSTNPAKPAKAKKSPKPGKPAATRKAVNKKISLNDGKE